MRVRSLTDVGTQQIYKAAVLHPQAAKYSCKPSLIFHLSSLYVILITSSLGMNQSFEMRLKTTYPYDTTINYIYSLSHTIGHCFTLSYCSQHYQKLIPWDKFGTLLFSLWITFAYQKPFSPLINRYLNFRERKNSGNGLLLMVSNPFQFAFERIFPVAEMFYYSPLYLFT